MDTSVSNTNIILLVGFVIILLFFTIIYKITQPSPNKPVHEISKTLVVEGFHFGNLANWGGNIFNSQQPTVSHPTNSIVPVVNIVQVEPPPFTEPPYQSTMESASWNNYAQIKSINEMNNLKLGTLDSFCNSYTGSADASSGCNQLTESNCKQVGCCVYTSNKKCVSGDSSGPTYFDKSVDYYYYKNKCHGSSCPIL